MSLKAQIGRRIFAKALPAAPLAATQAASNLAMNACNRVRGVGTKCGVNTAPEAQIDPMWPEKRKKLDAARAFLYSERRGRYIDYFRRRKNHFTTLDPNITALRSVSDQHKIHMHIAAEERLDQERQSWQENVLKMFGLTDKNDARELF